MDKIPVNNTVIFEVTFSDMTGAPFDPDSEILIKILSPTGIQTTLTYPSGLTRESLGVYSGVHEIDAPGDWVAHGQGNLSDGRQITSEDVVQQVERTYVNF